MAFRTNKMPAIEERTVSGSSVSFNSAFALPLKKCEVSFMATQSGSGTPSPQNVRPIIPVSSVDLLANSVSVIVPLGDSYGGGSLNLLTGKTEITYVLPLIKDLDLYYSSNNDYFFVTTTDKAYGISNVISEVLDTVAGSVATMPNYSIKGGNNRVIYIKATDYTDVASLKTAIGNYRIRYELETPIELSLTPTQLSSVVGNNIFSTDTGTLEITFADLQEKSASGSVASFNTALAMPLASCNIAVNAWQEGSGDPSPVNVRPIHGFSEVNTTRAGKNLFDISNQIEHAYITNSGFVELSGGSWNLSDFQPVKPNATYHFKPNTTAGGTAKHGYYDKDKNFISAIVSGEQTFTTPNNAYYMRFSYHETSTDIMLNFGSTALPYEPFVSSDTYPIQFGEEVYGAEVDAVNGVATVKWVKNVITSVSGWAFFPDFKQAYSTTYLSDLPAIQGKAHMKCELLKPINSDERQPNVGNFIFASNSGNGCAISAPNCESISDYETFVSNNPITFIYELTEPFDIQLTPTQIETLIGNNTIFADTGDVDLTFKDLDIAKRGNFREVFKLPS